MSDTNTTDDSTNADPLEPDRKLRDTVSDAVPSRGGDDPEPREVVHTHELDVDLDTGDVGVYDYQRHRNGDETVVLLLAFGGGYQALAMDVDAGGQVLEVEEIGDSPDESKAVGMLEYWLQQNPDGILGGEPDDGGGFLAGLGFGGDG